MNQLTLWDLGPGQICCVKSFSEELDHKVQNRLEGMGITVEQVMTCRHHMTVSGVVVIQVESDVLAVEQSVATKVRISIV